MARAEPLYRTADAVEVTVGYRTYFALLDVEVVFQEVRMPGGRVQRRRVTSSRIETAALLRASDLVNGRHA